MNRLSLFVVLAGCVGFSACSKMDGVAVAATPPAAAAPAAPAAAPNSGKVLQIQTAGAYTYAEVEAGGQKVWIAGGPLAAKPGDTVQWGDFAVMRNFHSKTLNRDFAEILFVNSWGPAGGTLAQLAPHGAADSHPAPAAGHPAMAAAHPAPAGAASAPAAGTSQGSVKSVTTAAGYTYIEVDQGNGVIWLAAPETPVKAGDKVRWGQGPVMQNFASKSLGRSFERIIFADHVEVVR